MSRYSPARSCQHRKLQGGHTCLLPAEAKREFALSTWQGFLLNLVHLFLQEKNPDVIFAKFDTSEDALEKVAEELKIQTLPSFKFFKGGKEVVDQVVGYKKKPIADAVEQLRSA